MTLHSVSPRFRLALLIDGENVSCAHADRIEAAAAAIGERQIGRVYGDAQRLAGWEQRGGLMLVHTGSGKNAADLRLCIDAVDLAHRKKLDGFVIASSDGDFLHLAQYLREAGFPVVGLGETKTPVRFRQACTRFELLKPDGADRCQAAKRPAKPAFADPPPSASSGASEASNLSTIDKKVCALLVEEGKDATLPLVPLVRLGARMRERFGLTKADLQCANWLRYLKAHGALYACKGGAPVTEVQWIGPPPIRPHVTDA